MSKWWLAVFLSVIVHCAHAQYEFGARAAGLRGSAVALSDVWSVHNNQAGLAWLKHFQASVYAENRFAMSGLTDKAAALSVPLGQGSAGLSIQSFGNSLFSSSKLGLAYGLRLSEKFSGGVQAAYQMVRISEGYGNRNALSVEGGVFYKVNQELTLATHLVNPTRARLADYNDERLVSQLRFGASYQLSKQVLMSAQVSKPSDREAAVSAGVEYRPAESFVLRFGAGSAPASYAFGVGWKWRSVQIDFASQADPVLGFSPSFALSWQASRVLMDE